jgi:hypothetical protein
MCKKLFELAEITVCSIKDKNKEKADFQGIPLVRAEGFESSAF